MTNSITPTYPILADDGLSSLAEVFDRMVDDKVSTFTESSFEMFAAISAFSSTLIVELTLTFTVLQLHRHDRSVVVPRLCAVVTGMLVSVVSSLVEVSIVAVVECFSVVASLVVVGFQNFAVNTNEWYN